MKNQIKWGVFIGYINMIISILITLIYTPLLLKFLGQSEYGVYSLIASVVAYLSVLDMGFGNAMVRFVSKSQAQRDSKEKKINGMFLFLYSIIGILALIIGIVLFSNISFFFKNSLSLVEINKAKMLMIILVCTISLSFPLSVFDSYIMANEKYVFLKILTIIKNISIPLLMIPLLFLGFKSIAMVIVTSTFNILFHMATMYYSFKKLKFQISFNINKFDKALFKDIVFYSFFIFLNLIVDTVFNNTDQVIIGSICGTAAVSVYAVAAKLSQMNTTFSTTVSTLFLPKITKLLAEKKHDEKISNLFIKVSKIQIYIMSFVLAGIIIFGKEFILIWAGKEYLDAYYIVLILIIPALIPLTQNIGLSIIQAKNIHQARSVMYIVIAILNIIISIPLTKRFQGIGAAIGSAIANVLGQIIFMNIFYYKKAKIDIILYWKNIINFCIPLLVWGYVYYYLIHLLHVNNITYIIVFAPIFVLLYFFYAYYKMNEEEKTIVKSIIKKYMTIFKLTRQ